MLRFYSFSQISLLHSSNFLDKTGPLYTITAASSLITNSNPLGICVVPDDASVFLQQTQWLGLLHADLLILFPISLHSPLSAFDTDVCSERTATLLPLLLFPTNAATRRLRGCSRLTTGWFCFDAMRSLRLHIYNALKGDHCRNLRYSVCTQACCALIAVPRTLT